MQLEGMTALVTGGESGIGAAIVERFLTEGARVVSADISVNAEAIVDIGERQFRAHVDVTAESSVDRLFAAVGTVVGPIDCLINCAGVGHDVPFLETSTELFDTVQAINLRGPFLMSKAAVPVMLSNGGGSVINIASVSGVTANRGRTAYGASKAGLIMMSRVMAVELGQAGLRVNVIAPGPIETPLVARMHDATIRKKWLGKNPMRRYGTTAEVAGAAAFLAGPDSGYVNGEVLVVDGGFATGHILPEEPEQQA